MIKDFNERFSLSSTIEDEQNKFVERVITFLNHYVEKFLNFESYKALFHTVCIQFGKNPKDYTIDLRGYVSLSDLEKVSGKEFLSILKLWTAVRTYYSHEPTLRSLFDDAIIPIINKSEIDLKIKYSDGQFYPVKDEFLDNNLIESPLHLLRSYRDEAKDFGLALQNHNSGNKYGIVENCYKCVEGLSRKILNNNQTLIDNKTELLKRFSGSGYWRKILANYIDYGNTYGRHASSDRHSIIEKESEAYLYLTGLLIRLIL
jgi:hypothetical protein